MASDLGMHCLPMCPTKDTRLIWVKGDIVLLLKLLLLDHTIGVAPSTQLRTCVVRNKNSNIKVGSLMW